MAKAKTISDVTIEEYQQIYAKFIRGLTLTPFEKSILKDAIAKNPTIGDTLNKAKAEYTASMRGGKNKKTTKSVYTALPGLNDHLSAANRNRKIASPGGFKQSGYDEDSQIGREGLITGGRFASRNKDGLLTFNGRTYSKAQEDWIVKRGLSGASLGVSDRMIYDSVMRERREAEAAAEVERQRTQENAMAQRTREQEEARRVQTNINRFKALGIKSGLGYEDYLGQKGLTEEDIANLSDEEIKALEESVENERKFNESELGKRLEAERKAKAEAEKNELLRQENNRKYGLHESAPLFSDKEYEAIRNGSKTWAQDPKLVKEMEDERGKLEEMLRSGEINGFEYQQMLDELNGRIGDLPYTFRDNPDAPTPAQMIEGIRQNGNWYQNNSGEWRNLSSVEEKLKNEQEKLKLAQEKQQMLQEKADNAPLKARQDAAMKALQAARTEWGKNPLNEGNEFDRDGFLANYISDYDAIYAEPEEAEGPVECPVCGEMFTGDTCPFCGWIVGTPVAEPDEPAAQSPAPTGHLKQSYL